MHISCARVHIKLICFKVYTEICFRDAFYIIKIGIVFCILYSCYQMLSNIHRGLKRPISRVKKKKFNLVNTTIELQSLCLMSKRGNDVRKFRLLNSSEDIDGRRRRLHQPTAPDGPPGGRVSISMLRRLCLKIVSVISSLRVTRCPIDVQRLKACWIIYFHDVPCLKPTSVTLQAFVCPPYTVGSTTYSIVYRTRWSFVIRIL